MANIYSVSTEKDLMSALASAKGGDTIELAGGDYGDLTLADGWTDFNVKFETPVTIRSADVELPASFSSLELRGVSNLTLENLVFDYEFDETDAIWVKPFQVLGDSNNIIIRNSVFDGDLASGLSDIDNGYGYGIGLNVRDSSNISVENNEFFNWHRGALYTETDNLSVTNNEVHAIRSDGFDFAGVNSVIIEGNYIHDFNSSPVSTDHPDMIQVWTNSTPSPTTDFIIRNNTFDIGEGGYTQSIFMRNGAVDSGQAGTEMYYQNILIENNTIYNGHTHGITVGETDGLTIRNNSVLQAEGGVNDLSGGVSIPKINLSSASTSVVIEGNIVSAINGFDTQSDWTVSGNAIIQPSDYQDQFIASTIDTDNGAHKFIAQPNSMIEQLGAGSDHIQFPDAPDALTPLFQVHSDETSEHTLILDASLTVGPLGLVSEGDAKFLWTFEDGRTATGQIVKHDFATSGYHGVTLSVVSQDGTTAQAEFTAGIAGNDIVQFDMQSGQFEALAYGEEITLGSGDVPLQKNAGGNALKLGGEGTQASIAASELSFFFGTDAFELSMSLKADSAASWGEIARIHTSFTASVDKNGNFSLDLFLDDGTRVKVASKGISLNDGTLHDVTARFDGEAGFAEILIDGQVVASESVSGSLGGGARSLDFGNPWSGHNFDGELSAFALSADSQDFPIYTGSADVISDISTAASDTATTPEADTATDSEPLPEEDSGTLEPLLLLRGGYELDFANIPNSDTVRFLDDAHIVDTEGGQALSFDGKKDYASLGRMSEFEDSQKIAFSVDFTKDSTDGSAERLVWNHVKIGLTLEGDGIRVHAANNDDHFSQGFQIAGLGLNDGNQHSATVMVDAETDRLQVVVDDVLILDEQNTDFDIVGAGGHEWGWSLGTAWNRWFEGEIHEFQVSDDFDFVDSTSVQEDASLLA